jgi:hypothetical protein
MKTVRACDIVRLDAATWVRADVGLDSLARRQMDEALVANEDGPLLASQLQTKQEQRLVSTTNPDCATAASRRP